MTATKNLVFEVTSDQYPQVICGKQYSIAHYAPRGMVKLVGISHPVPLPAGVVVSATQQKPNIFVVTRYKLVEEIMAVTNIPGEESVSDLVLVDTRVVEHYIKNEKEVLNVSEFILKYDKKS